MNQTRVAILRVLIAGIWLLIPLLLAVIGYATFVVPKTVATLQAQGVQELPIGLQLLVDLSDFCKTRWFVVLPLLLILAFGTSRFLTTLQTKNT